MKSTYLHQLSTSFRLWVNHEILAGTEAYTNVSGVPLLNQTSPNYYGINTFASPYSQWVSDSSVNGAFIPSGVMVNGNPVNRGSNGLHINFENGRVVTDNTVPANASVTANVAVKDFNIYYNSQDIETMLITKIFKPKPTTPQELKDFPENGIAFPCIFIMPFASQNVPYALGGMDRTQYEFRLAVIADNPFKLDGVISIIQDSARKCFPFIPDTLLPYDEYGDLKSGQSYNYNDYIHSMNLIYIDMVRVSRFNETLNQNISPKVIGSFIDITVEQMRYPRKDF